VTQEWIVPAALGAVALLALVLAVVLLLGRARTDRELRAAQAEAASLRAQVDEIERRIAAPVPHPTNPDRTPDEPDYVITHLGDEMRVARHSATPVGDGTVAPVAPALFADLVLRETVVKAASLAHGLRVALAPEVRNRIRFEVRREVRAARKRRRRAAKAFTQRARAAERERLPDDEDAA
jgi:hypothetical protein